MIRGMKLVHLKRACRIFAVSERTFRRWIHRGIIRAKKVGGRWYTTEEAINELLSVHPSDDDGPSVKAKRILKQFGI